MPLQMRRLGRRLGLWIAALTSLLVIGPFQRIPGLGERCAWADACDVLDVLITRDADALAAVTRAENMAASPLRTRVLDAIREQRTRIGSALDEIAGGRAVAESELANLQTGLLRLKGIAEATAAREVEIAAAAARVNGWPANAARTRVTTGLQEELARFRDLQGRVLDGASVRPGELAALEGRLGAYREIAEGPPVRLDRSTHHDPTSPHYTGGTPVPADAESAFARAIPEAGTGGSTWWSFNGGQFYRYQGGVAEGMRTLHWNGMTTGARAIATDDVPIAIRRFFGAP